MSRKTVSVQHVKDVANRMLNDSKDDVDRNGIIVLLETILHDTGNYEGFRYTALPEAFDYESTDWSKWDTIDQTRRFYS